MPFHPDRRWLAFFLAWALPLPAASEPRLVTVTGDAEVRVSPDEVILTLGIETWSTDLSSAKTENDGRVKEVLDLTRSFGIGAQHVQTDHISIEPRYRDGYEKRDFIGYFVQKTVVVTLRDLSRFEDLLTRALQAGVNYVHGIQFRTTELRRHRDEARSLALRAAREKAERLASELGQQLGPPHSIQETSGGWWSWYNAWWGRRWQGPMTQNVVQDLGGGEAAPESGFAPGQITVSARVTVAFEMQ